MKIIKEYTFREDLKKRLKDPEFRKAWKESELEYRLSKQIIEARLKQDLSQGDLAKKVETTQAVISRIETMSANPSIGLLKRIARALKTPLQLQIN
ncbi:MAG: helix-turn-helix transcriptional regulator [bacterium]|nr:helix-turn-helix transcriptional regulator [bacterium]